MYVNCYLSPEGKFYYGLLHVNVANQILEEVYGITIDTVKTEQEFEILRNPERFLEESGWMKYIQRCNVGWWIHPKRTPTQEQINAVFRETGEDITKLGGLF